MTPRGRGDGVAGDPGCLAHHFQALVEHASDLITLIRPDGTIVYQSPSGERALGFPPDEIVGWNAFELVHPDDHERTRRVLAEAIARPGRIGSTAIRMRHRDGSWRDLECVGKLVRIDGLGDHVVVNSRDVTERSAIGAALAASESRYRRLFEEDIAGHVMAAVDGRIVECNRAFAEMFGFDSPEQARQWNIHALAADGAPRLPFAPRTGPECRTERLRLAMRRRDGEPVYVLACLSVDADAAGTVRCLHAQMLDETVVRTLTAQLEAAHRIESLGLLAGGIAHHFNNILSVMLGHADLGLRRASGDADLARHLSEIVHAGERAAALTRRLLAAGRKQPLDPRSVSLHDVVADVRPMLMPLIGEDIALGAERGPGGARVLVDPGQLEQVVMELVLNTRDALPEGGRVVLATREEEVGPAAADREGAPPPGRYAVLEVRDDGTGMDPATRDRIFQPFFTTREPGRNAGLGLSIVHGIVHRSGGHVRVESEPGRGSSFSIYLPLDESGRGGADGEEATEEALEPKRPTLLLVEDEESVRGLIAEVLRNAGHTVTEAGDGRAALELLTSAGAEPPGLIISDLMMPHLSGRRLAEHARRILPRVPVLFISGYHEDLFSDEFPREGGFSFLQKPFAPSELLDRVRMMTSRAAGLPAGLPA